MRLIDADRLKTDFAGTLVALERKPKFDGLQTILIRCVFDMVGKIVDNAPTVDAVPVNVIEQFKWERDTAIQQLEEHGISFGCKADVVPVVRCVDCKWWFKDENYDGLYRCANDGLLRKGDHYCADGERKDDGSEN